MSAQQGSINSSSKPQYSKSLLRAMAQPELGDIYIKLRDELNDWNHLLVKSDIWSQYLLLPALDIWNSPVLEITNVTICKQMLQNIKNLNFIVNEKMHLYISKMVPKFSGFLSKKNSGGFPGTNSSQRPRISRGCWSTTFLRRISYWKKIKIAFGRSDFIWMSQLDILKKSWIF